ncbi:site-2 protease family protein [Clostridium formicaceticum]|uniref:Stage IV sporulation protein FB n=1 Tax=Clostridium formicaceticum TaxID=1497 RepID=A0AAC9RLQ5_9CLOT|nr:site-2 protease family protein [Clostridium formicaceticum]AOY76858.1 hypothetical protein BJL90_13965 [Clostridium formicaceticum]ARE87338.1 Stage IV sporulation protein FB [Clostridium formicaceticum]
MKLFKLFGIYIKINYMLLPIFIFSIYYKYFFQLIVMTFIIIVHELAHALTSIYYGIMVEEIELFPFGGVAKVDNYFEIDPFKEMIIAIVGPTSNFIMLLVALILQSYIALQIDLVYFFIFANLTIGLFNMLPILPLDGGRILRAYISSKIGFKKATKIAIRCSKILAILLFLAGFHFGLKAQENLFLCGIAFFLYIQTNKEKEMMGYTSVYQIVTKKKQLLEKGIMDVKYLTALESIDLRKAAQEFSTWKYHFVTVINTKGKVLGNLSESEILDAMIKYNYRMTLGDLIEMKK